MTYEQETKDLSVRVCGCGCACMCMPIREGGKLSFIDIHIEKLSA
jgi:hypothetical protein